MTVFELWPPALYIAAGVIGLLVGSFLNVVAYRIPLMMERAWRRECDQLASDASTRREPEGEGEFNLLWPPSSCPACGHRIRARHNVPILSYLWLRGRCADCGVRISPRYPFVEFTAGVLAIVSASVFGPTWQLVAALGFTWTLFVLALIDIDHQLLPDSITQPLLWAGLLVSLFSVDNQPLFVDVRSAILGAAVGYLSLWSVYHVFKIITGKEGMGYGDFKLLAAIGAWLGWQMLPLVILLSAAVGAVVGSVLLLASKRDSQTPVPFGPYLSAAGWVAMLWGRDLYAWYGRFFH